MKAALLHYAAPPVVGGVESVIGHHARLMANAGNAVQVVAGRGAQTDPRVPFIHLPLADSRHPEVLVVKKELDAGCIPPAFYDLTRSLVQQLGEALAEVDVLIAHNVCSLNKNLPLTAALKELFQRRGAPRLVLWHHDLAWTTPRYRGELHEGFPWDLLRTDWSEAVQVVVSEPRQQELAALAGVPPERIQVVPNGVDPTQVWKLETQTEALVRELNLLDYEPLLLLPVRITPRKNIELALRALAALRERGLANAGLVVTGPLGPHNPNNVSYFARLTTLRDELGLKGAAHFLAELVEGYLPDAVIYDFYRLADALVLPSWEEGFGIPVLEAGLARLPVLCADIPPLRKLGGGQAEYFSPEAEPGEVAELIEKRLRTDPNFSLSARVKRSFTWERIYVQKIAPLLDPKGGT